ncbi:G2/mitotic-specific cyclin S13-7-like isoform X1 [Trifolium pratense]|nr:G2/mitotic-specific cyclin S13-7-like isoform X1 [Trifolium pratense]
MDTKSKGKHKGKQKEERSNRRVLGDIGNLEGNQVSRPITRNFHKKLLEKAEAAANSAPELEVPANCDQGATLRNQNVGDDCAQKPNPEAVHVDSSEAGEKLDLVPKKEGSGRSSREDPILNSPLTTLSKPNPEAVDVDSSEAGEKLDSVPKKEGSGKSAREDQIPNSPPTTKSKIARRILIEPEDQPVDMDADDDTNNLAADEYLDELYNFYKLTEEENRASDYMESQKEINTKMRTIVVDWLVEVHRHFKLKTETLFLNINIIDRYLSLINVPKKELQLVAICSMSLACKYEEVSYPKVNDLLEISDKFYNRRQFISRERDIVEKLQWNFTVTTPYVFLVRLIRASIVQDKEMENMAFYLAELGLGNYYVMVLFSPSQIAAAAVYSARCILNRIQYWNQYLQNLAGYCIEQIKDCAKLLVRIYASAADVKTKSVYNKFSSPRKGHIALLPQPRNIEERL